MDALGDMLEVFEGDGSQIQSARFTTIDAELPWMAPSRHYPGDAGYDLSCSEEYRIKPGQLATVRTNIAVALPFGVWAMVTGRSSTFHKLGLITNTGIIDQGYRGELFASVFNTSKDHDVVVHVGDRLIQLIMFPLITPSMYYSHKLEPSDRGVNGFGSTGK